jgi:uncharacterized protein YbjQ (UPF0145 family)
MKRHLLIALLASACAMPALARDTVLKLPLADVLTSPEAQGKLDGSVKFYLAGQPTPKVLKRVGDDISNRKTNGFNKSEKEGCQWAALSALMAFQEKAKQLGANAVIDMESYYKKNAFSSPTDYECHSGTFVVGVTFKGVYAKVAQ